MSPMVLFEAVWLESPASQLGLAKLVPLQPLKAPEALEALGGSWKDGPVFFWHWPLFQRFGTRTALKVLWERFWEAVPEALGKAHLQLPQKSRKQSMFWGL